MKYISFVSQYITNPRNVGAVLPGPKFLAEKMMESIKFEKAKYIRPLRKLKPDRNLLQKNPKKRLKKCELTREENKQNQALAIKYILLMECITLNFDTE
ncbi:hypothetical protein [Bacillus sp. FSL K6-0268]|uniref:hypothetical protein n=1 Tax=Bacillus sp. FSL K6-0268 TaxID=2921449 RepID=UPI004046DA4A